MQKELEDRMRAAREEVVYLYTCTWVNVNSNPYSAGTDFSRL